MEKYELLIVDDEKSVADALRDSAELLNIYHATPAYSGAEALKLCGERRYDAYLVDQRMPGMTGVEFIEALLKFDATPLVYIVTAEDDGVALAAAEKAHDAGRLPIRRYVSKPWPQGLFSVELREDLREFELRNRMMKMISDYSTEQGGTQRALTDAQTRLSALEKREASIAGANVVVGAVFHELNNINTGIYGNAYRLNRLAERSGGAAAGELPKALVELAASLNDLSTRMQDYTRFTQDLVANVNERASAAPLSSMINLALADLAAELGEKKIEIVLALENDSPVICQKYQLRHAFYHLLKNAVEASDDGGKIYITVRRTGDRMILRLRDEGKGLAAADAPAVFVPLFTRVKVYGGRGGSVAHRIVTHNHHGQIDLESYTAEMISSGNFPGKTRGTEVRVSLPVAG